MDITLLIIGFTLCIIGIIGSFLPILPGPPISWTGLLALHLSSAIAINWWFLGITGIIALLVFALDYVIPIIGTKKFGGTKAGMIGTTIGLIIGILAPIPYGIIIGPFVGALLGELTNKADGVTAFKAAFGSFLGFITGTFMKFIMSLIFLGLFCQQVWEFRKGLFPFFY